MWQRGGERGEMARLLLYTVSRQRQLKMSHPFLKVYGNTQVDIFWQGSPPMALKF